MATTQNNDLISRSALLTSINLELVKTESCTSMNVDALKYQIISAPAVPMAPVKIERYDNGQGRCPLCKTDIPFQVVNDKWAFEPYCPHCGVKMDLEDDAK